MKLNRTLARLVLALTVVLGTAAAGVPNASAAPALCNVFGEHTQGVSKMQMFCQGSNEWAGVWDLELANGLVSGTAPGGRTITGSYVEVPNCTIYISVSIYKCIYIFAEVCVNGYCVTVDIVICIWIDVDICISIYARSIGDGVVTPRDTALGRSDLAIPPKG